MWQITLRYARIQEHYVCLSVCCCFSCAGALSAVDSSITINWGSPMFAQRNANDSCARSDRDGQYRPITSLQISRPNTRRKYGKRPKERRRERKRGIEEKTPPIGKQPNLNMTQSKSAILWRLSSRIRVSAAWKHVRASESECAWVCLCLCVEVVFSLWSIRSRSLSKYYPIQFNNFHVSLALSPQPQNRRWFFVVALKPVRFK